MIDKIRAYVEEYQMIEPGDHIIVGVSGGADSVCLLFVLQELQSNIPFTIHVVHVNHGIRAEAGADAAYVEKLCETYHLPFYLIEEDVPALADTLHLSTEEAGRKVRYEAFERILAQVGHGKIAVAHHQNDRAETVLFHLFRGSGVRGMAGIMPVHEHVIRPLLCVTRSQIETYLTNIHTPYCDDKTNAEDTYTRNKIRHQIVPYVEENICSHAIEHIVEAAETLEEVERLLQKLSLQAYATCVTTSSPPPTTPPPTTPPPTTTSPTLRIAITPMLTLDTIIQQYLIMHCVEQVAGSKQDITSVHIKQILSLLTKQVGKQVSLPYHCIARREYESVAIYTIPEDEPVREETEGYILLPNTVYEIPGLGMIKTRLWEKCGNEIIPENTYTKWFDYDKIEESVILRTRKKGDYLTIDESNHKKSLKQYMIDSKIPQAIRQKTYMIADGPHILWVIGYRISQQYKVDQNTKHILEIHMIGGKDHGRAN
ncbi:MAG: tRNA lysidine(34) synthetase TilS [Lachnospiraceae bacterium]